MSSTDPRPLVSAQAQAPIPLRPTPPPERPASLPLPLTSFVGREHEIEAIAALTCRAGVRLVTLTGPGGVGKTRLAIRVTEQIAPHFPDGVWYVPLAAVPSAELVPASVAQALDVELAGGDAIAKEIAQLIGDKRALLIMDNVEHLLDCGTFVVGLLGACPRLTVLATSRSLLRLSGEHVVRVPPLSLSRETRDASHENEDPTHGSRLAAHGSESMRLFVERAEAADSAFAMTPANAPAVSAICRRLDGLPLAIELAAARIAAFPPAQLLDRLAQGQSLLTDGPRDAPPRQQAMRDAIGWSYGLLTPEHQALFRRLAVFAGGFTPEGAEAVAGGQVESPGPHTAPAVSPPIDVLGGIASLVDQSLVRRGEGPAGEARFGMLETIREFGLQRLLACGEATPLRDAHAAYFVELAVRGGAGLRGDSEQQAPIWHRLDAEIGNFRAALGWLRDRGRIEDALRLAGGLDWFWTDPTYRDEGRRWLADLLERAPDTVDPVARAQAHTVAGSLANLHGDARTSRMHVEAALPLWRSAGREISVAETLLVLASAAFEEDRLYADTLAREAGEIALRCGAAWAEAAALHISGRVATASGEPGRALPLLRRAVERFRDADDPFRELGARCDEGLALLLTGERAAAQEVFVDALETDMVINEDRGMAPHALLGIAALVADGEPQTAARLAGAASAQLVRVGRLLTSPTMAAYDALTAPGRTRLGEAAWQAAWTAGRTLVIEEAANEGRLALRRFAVASKAQPHATGAAAELGLTRRELEVLRLVTDGLTDREIADRLFIARRTASKHVEGILAKLGVSSRREAAAEARRLGLS